MENENQVNTVETQKEQEEQQVEKKSNSKEVVRELSKMFSINLFDETELQTFKEKITSKDTELETAKTQLAEYQTKEQLFAQKEQDYNVQIEALGMGFKREDLNEVLALAKVNTKDGQTIMDGLKAVQSKYGKVFIATNIGMQKNNFGKENPDVAKNEQQQYLEKNSRAYQIYNKKN